MNDQGNPSRLPFNRRRTQTDVFSALLRARREFGGKKIIIIDGDERKMSYTEIVQAAFALGHALKKHTKAGENVGVMLPTGVGAALAFYALSAYGRVPAMLNFTAGSRNLKSAMTAGEVTKIITAHKFVELGGLEDLVADLGADREIIYLEDVRESIGISDKAAGAIGPFAPFLFRRRSNYKSPGVILFTSGTEGEPKGVVLSHQNVLANVDQVRAHIGLSDKTDRLFNPLPTFHCFGLTVGAILPLMAGVPVMFHPTPLQPREIVNRIRKDGSTILLATDTFINQYARAGREGDMSSVRLAVCGAERVKDETRALVRRKFEIEILEGEPKGVVLSHQNVLANVDQVRAHIGLSDKTDRLFNPLPTFHCFGLTVGAILPLMAGVPVMFHPTPLQPREIVNRIRKDGSTILLATDTFINQYARAGREGDMSSVRLAVCGAERVKDETRALVRRKFEIEILEGYGATEASPVVAANMLEDNRPGTVGTLMADMDCELVPVEGISDGGRMRIRGPNIMMGYLRASSPGVLERPEGGWHDTGDIVSIDSDGCIRIKGRVKRFAKIAGEMVSLAVVENCASAIWPDNMHAAATMPDPRKGEQIILLSDAKDCNREDILSWAQNHGVPELSVPKKVFHVEEIPVLGTGKIDYGAIQKMATNLVEA